MSIKDKAIVLRAGVVTTKQITDGCRIDTNGNVSGLSVQVWDTNTDSMTDRRIITKLLAPLQPITYNSWAVARARDFTAIGGTVTWKQLRGNPLHAEISGLSVDQIVTIFSRNQY